MDRIKFIVMCILAGLLSFFGHGQKIGNYIANGSFENWTDCNHPYWLYKVKNWGAVDSISQSGMPASYCNGLVPNHWGTNYQFPRTGGAFVFSTFFISYPNNSKRWYIKNRLKSNLQNGVIYCVKFHVNILNTSPYGCDGFGIYFGDSTIDTITKCLTPLSYLNPQIKCQPNVPITDTLGWTVVSGTFVATGNEKYAIIGIFEEDASINSVVTNSSVSTTQIGTDACIDDVSCIALNLPAYAGLDTSIYLGDSTYIGRQPDYVIDTSCIWFKLPNTLTAIDTVSGLWVKPTTTSTYVVRQELDCSAVKWDTVVVSVKEDIDETGIDERYSFADNIALFPNPTSDFLSVSFSGQVPADISSFTIINNIGQVVRRENVDLSNGSTDIRTSELADGLYQIHFDTRFGTTSKKFVKTKD